MHIFRNYSAFFVVISSAILVSVTNLAAGKDSSGFLFGYLESPDNYENPLEGKMYLASSKKNNLSIAPLAQAKTSPNPKNEDEDEEMIVEGQALVAGSSPVKKDPQEGEGVIIYEVKEGDTVSSIAEDHKISVNTIRWANEIDDLDSIMPGDKIFILPVSGLSYTVKKGDTLDDIAKEYKAQKEQIIAFNDLPANGEIEKGQELMIPGGEKEIEVQIQDTSSSMGIAAREYESFQSVGKKLSGKAGTGHKFPYGYCTWYVSQRKYVPWGGNAGTWLYNARSMGYSTGKKPQAGAIIVTSESWWGHVGIVEKVSGSTITISEMNHQGWGVKSTRTLNTKNRVIKGYIY